MVDVDPDFRRANRGEWGAQPILNCGVQRDRYIHVLRRCRRFRQQFSTGKERIFFQHAFFIPDAHVLAEFAE